MSLRGRAVDPIKVANWYREHYWPQRVAEYDRHLDDINRAEREACLSKSSREAMADHIAMIEQGKEIAMRELEKLLATVKDSAAEVLKPRDVIHLLDATIKADRLIRGEATANVNIDGPDLSHLTNEQLAALDEMIGGPGNAPDTRH